MGVGHRASNPIPEKYKFFYEISVKYSRLDIWKNELCKVKKMKTMELQEDVMEDLKNLEVKNWKETAKDRRT